MLSFLLCLQLCIQADRTKHSTKIYGKNICTNLVMSCILYDLHSLTTAQITNYHPNKLALLSCETLFMCPHRHMHTYAFMHTWSFQHRGNLLGPGVKGHTAVLNERRWVCDDRFYVQWRGCVSEAKDYHLIKDKMKATWYGRALAENFTSKEIQISICCI